MKLRKATRKRIYEAAAEKKSVTIAWPASAPTPRKGHKYPVRGFDSETKLVVEHRKELKDGRWEATVRLDHDPIRLLYGLSPVRNDDGALETEPERVPSRYERLLAMEGRQKTAMMGEQQRLQNKRYAKEEAVLAKNGRSRRSQRAKERHLESIERRAA